MSDATIMFSVLMICTTIVYCRNSSKSSGAVPKNWKPPKGDLDKLRTMIEDIERGKK
jgi:hypothetical protein